MKSLLLTLALIPTFAFAHGPAPRGGGADGGGDVALKLSTAEQVSNAIDQAHTRLKQRGFIVAFGHLNRHRGHDIEDVVLTRQAQPERLLKVIDSLDFAALRNAIRAATFEKRTTGSCMRSDGTHADASVDMSDPYSPICFSIERLRRIPFGLLKGEVFGLMVHEFMHKMGANEENAQLVQAYIMAEVVPSRSEDRIQLFSKTRLLSMDISGLKLVLNSQKRELICMMATALSQNTLSLRREFVRRDADGKGDPAEQAVMEKFHERFRAIDQRHNREINFEHEGMAMLGLSDISRAYCLNKANERDLLAFANDLQPVISDIQAAIPQIIRPGLTLEK